MQIPTKFFTVISLIHNLVVDYARKNSYWERYKKHRTNKIREKMKIHTQLNIGNNVYWKHMGCCNFTYAFWIAFYFRGTISFEEVILIVYSAYISA